MSTTSERLKTILGGGKKALPILTFPAATAMGITVKEMLLSADRQAAAMAKIAAETPSAAAVSFMDLSVEAECFGAKVHFSDEEIPTIVGQLVSDEASADALAIPAVGSGRSGICLEAIALAKKQITDRPVFAGMIGPFSLAARLFDVSEIMMACFDEPEVVHTVLKKATEFLTAYAKAFRAAGADGILLAEPVAGLLSPAMAEEFSSPYVKEIVDAAQEETFPILYHNCGNNVIGMMDSLLSIGAAGYHFGNAIDMRTVLEKVPADVLVMGNVDPAGQFRMGTPDSIRQATLDLLHKVGNAPNFILSSGCDVPPGTPWDNIRAFYAALGEYQHEC